MNFEGNKNISIKKKAATLLDMLRDEMNLGIPDS